MLLIFLFFCSCVFSLERVKIAIQETKEQNVKYGAPPVDILYSETTETETETEAETTTTTSTTEP